MTFIIAKPAISRRRKMLALAVAGVTDIIQIALLPIFLPTGYVLDDILDVIVGIILLGIVGFRWQLVVAFALELVPGFDIFPTWAAFILTIPSVPTGVTATTVPHAADTDIRVAPESSQITAITPPLTPSTQPRAADDDVIDVEPITPTKDS